MFQAITIPLIHVTITGDFLAGAMLSQLVEWDRENRARVQREGKWWIPCPDKFWCDLFKVTPAHARKLRGILNSSGLIQCKTWQTPTGGSVTHIYFSRYAYNNALKIMIDSNVT